MKLNSNFVPRRREYITNEVGSREPQEESVHATAHLHQGKKLHTVITVPEVFFHKIVKIHEPSNVSRMH